MSSFDEWWEENYMMLSADRTEAEDIYNIGAQSRQAEIDELKKRIDRVLEYIGDDCNCYYTGSMVNEIHIILAGEDE